LRVHASAPTVDVKLFEASDQLGGLLRTERRDGFLIERSADSFITDTRWGVDFCRKVGLESQLINTRETDRRAFVVRRGRLVPIPVGFQIMAPTSLWSIWSSPLLSVRGKLRLCGEPWIPRRASDAPEESLEEFATRRLGREVFERLVQPLVSGIYAANPQQLSVAATMPRFIEMERRHGSLVRGLRATQAEKDGDGQESGARYGMFVSLRDGIGSLIDAVRERLPTGVVRENCRIDKLSRRNGRWSLSIEGKEEAHPCDRLILATSSRVAAGLLRDCDERLAEKLQRIRLGSCAVVCLGYQRDQMKESLHGFGFVVPSIENRPLLAASYASEKFAGRAPDDAVLVRAFIGGADREDLMDLDDRELSAIAQDELRDLAGFSGTPLLSDVSRWTNAMPQYHVGHLSLVEEIENHIAQLGHLAVIGNAFHGVGIPACIHHAELAVDRLLSRQKT